MHELNELVLGSALSELPQLTSLHVIECSKVDHTAILRLISHTPFLESLSFTSWESPRVLPTSISALHYLRHLTVDTHCTLTPSATPSLWTSIIALTRSWSCSLKSLTLRLSDKLLLGDAFIKDVLDVHHATLTHLALLNCGLSLEGIRLICSRCTSLQRFAVSVPTKEIHGFSQALARSRSLHTLTDVGDIHHSHAQRAPISKLDVRTIMEHVQSLEKVIADGRVWAADRTDGFMGEGMRLYVQKRASSSPVHWFMPP
ncbi:hypothetical protein A0H81_03167 [Grifola frondosa]|uniref:RNI-like protein n=1 Tax=Grifola frondosa TaxID=5627 RepID=A0A1C7MIN8_GRIFR|nr:hypothetical protein A0H81_03167 [Grifola frondosa]